VRASTEVRAASRTAAASPRAVVRTRTAPTGHGENGRPGPLDRRAPEVSGSGGPEASPKTPRNRGKLPRRLGVPPRDGWRRGLGGGGPSLVRTRLWGSIP
jgi:hypothetical protein